MASPYSNPGYVSSAALKNITVITSKLKHQITGLLNIKKNDYVLDVGCGSGTDTINFAQQVKKCGLVVGIDHDAAMVFEAQKKVRDSGLSDYVQYINADAKSIPFASNSFAACRCERVFQHLTNDLETLQEIVRVTRQGGRVVVADSDWASLSIDTSDTRLERRIVQGIAELLNNGYAGRTLVRLFMDCGLVDLTVDACPIIWRDYQTFCNTSLSILNLDNSLISSGVVSKSEIRKFRDNLLMFDARGAFFATGTIILVSGKKPI